MRSPTSCSCRTPVATRRSRRTVRKADWVARRLNHACQATELLEPRRLMAVTGAIFTTDLTGTTVNGNIYAAKTDVYVNGGPKKDGAAGLPPGDYYVQVTNPSGSVVLGSTVTLPDDPDLSDTAHVGFSRPFHVNANGELDLDNNPATKEVLQLSAILDDPSTGLPGVVDGYADTPNPGGEYKVWVSQDPTFKNSESKTDNFKVRDADVETRLGYLVGTKYEDRNGNGTLDAGKDFGLEGWVIYLDGDDDGALDWVDGNANKLWDAGEGEQWTVTSALGAYGFIVPAGDAVTYVVREAGFLDADGDIVPLAGSGWIQTSDDPASIKVVDAGESIQAGDFGNFELGCLSGYKYADPNNNGKFDPGEGGLAGWTIILDDDGDGVVEAGERSATTDAAGAYKFDDVGPGPHTLTEVLQSGWTQTYAPKSPFAFESGDALTGLNFGNFGSACLSGYKYEDKDGDGQYDAGETGLKGWTVILDDDGDGVAEAGERTATTDAAGYYSFKDVAAGSHTVTEVLVAGWTQTYAPKVPFSVTAGDDVRGLDFGNFRNVCLSGYKLEDLDGDGSFDAGEAGVLGWTIILDDDGNGEVDAGERTAVTDKYGFYKFDDVGPGSHTLTEVQQPGWTQTYAPKGPFTVCSGGNLSSLDFGNFRNVCLTGTKYEDCNGNGRLDYGEVGLAGWTIILDDDGDGVAEAGERTAVTDKYGAYKFSNVGPGAHSVTEVLKAGWTQTFGPKVPFKVRSGCDVVCVDFGNFKNVCLTGTKYEDKNGNGKLDAGEVGLGGWTIILDDNGNGKVDAGEKTAVTDKYGAYKFANVGPGSHKVTEVLQPGWTQTFGPKSAFVVKSGTDVYCLDFGNFKNVCITGTKYEDKNGNGKRDAGEVGLGGWTIILNDNGNGCVDAGEKTTVTDSYGNYKFANVGPGSVRLSEVLKPGWTQTAKPAAFNPFSGCDVACLDFGNFKNVCITGTKYEDKNGNGKRDSGESVLCGWTIILNDNGNGCLDKGEQSTVTDAYGNYKFSNVGPGTVKLSEVLKPGWTQTAKPAAFATCSGRDVACLDFGNFKNVCITGTKYEDRNGNGKRDSGEKGLCGWTIILNDNGNGCIDKGEQTAVTDAYGNYKFANVGPGIVKLSEVLKAGWTQTAKPAAFATCSGRDVACLDFGNFANVCITGTKYEDKNGNGKRDSGENGLCGWTIILDDNGNGCVDKGEQTAVTDSYGNYKFANVGPGSHKVTEVLQAGWTQTAKPASFCTFSNTPIACLDFGNFKNICLTGTKYEDRNGNGKRDAGENGLAGWTIILNDNGNGKVDAGEKTAVTDKYGVYKFANVGPGLIKLTEVLKAGWTQTAKPAAFNAWSGRDVACLDFGNRQVYCPPAVA